VLRAVMPNAVAKRQNLPGSRELLPYQFAKLRYALIRSILVKERPSDPKASLWIHQRQKKTFSGLAIRFHPSLARGMEILHPTTI
jgi:hypothetical protein